MTCYIQLLLTAVDGFHGDIMPQVSTPLWLTFSIPWSRCFDNVCSYVTSVQMVCCGMQHLKNKKSPPRILNVMMCCSAAGDVWKSYMCVNMYYVSQIKLFYIILASISNFKKKKHFLTFILGIVRILRNTSKENSQYWDVTTHLLLLLLFFTFHSHRFSEAALILFHTPHFSDLLNWAGSRVSNVHSRFQNIVSLYKYTCSPVMTRQYDNCDKVKVLIDVTRIWGNLLCWS